MKTPLQIEWKNPWSCLKRSAILFRFVVCRCTYFVLFVAFFYFFVLLDRELAVVSSDTRYLVFEQNRYLHGKDPDQEQLTFDLSGLPRSVVCLTSYFFVFFCQ